MYINKLAKNVVVSCGPIPAKLDSVKYLTNVFKGGLAFETARRLAAARAERDHRQMGANRIAERLQ
jgi:hypothetical protein